MTKRILSNSSEILCSVLRQLCEANCWGLISGIEQLEYNTLSPATTFFQEVWKAQSMKMAQFHLGGQLTKNNGFNSATFFQCGTGTSIDISLLIIEYQSVRTDMHPFVGMLSGDLFSGCLGYVRCL